MLQSSSSSNALANFLRLPRHLSLLEAWGFGLTGLLLWISSAPGAHLQLGSQAIFVWLPGVIIGVTINFQVKHLGDRWQDMSGGTPNYITRLLDKFPLLGTYAAIGYYISWVAVLPANAIIITDFITTNLEPLGITAPETLLRIALTALAFIVAFSGTRSLGILHLFFVVPAVGFLTVFCVQGMGWLALSPDSPGLFPSNWSTFDFGGWAQWYVIATYAVYACETASAFIADSKQPRKTLQILVLAAWFIPIVYLGGSWVLMRLATQPGLADNAYLNLLAASQPFWGDLAPLLVTFLVVSGSLLSCATAASNSPRMLYQLALDGYISPVFAVTSRQGVLGPSLVLTLFLSLVWLIWGDLARIVFVTGIGWLFSFIALHWGLWLKRGEPGVLWPRLSLGFAIFESIALIVGGLAWNWQDLLIGLLLPPIILAGDALMRRISFAPFHPGWWQKRYSKPSRRLAPDFMLIQVLVLIALVSCATSATWIVKGSLQKFAVNSTILTNFFVLLLLLIAFVEVAIAGWTSLPQVTSLAEAKEQAEHLFKIAIEPIVVVNEKGIIVQVNPATEILFRAPASHLLQHHFSEFFPELDARPDLWENRSEHMLNLNRNSGINPDINSSRDRRIIEISISSLFHEEFHEYVGILRDITERKRQKEILEAMVKEQTADLAAANEAIAALNKRLKADNLRMGAELDILRQMQQLILPKQQELAEIEELDIAGYMEPADEVGGDYYDVLHTDGIVTIGIGDVTGHGLESGILMVMAQTAVRTLKEIQEQDPVRFLDTINRTIYKNISRMNSDKNLTLAILNYVAGAISISGQHEETIVVRKGGQIERIDTIDLGFPIGLGEEIAHCISHTTVKLEPGDGVVLYTDGIPEAEDIHGKFYGVERLCAAVSHNWHQDAEQVKQAVIEDVRRFIGEQKVFDDITLVVFKRKSYSAVS
ncbi:MAG TPA: histidine kinase [Cyanobacteria bacterium UBA8803]|nr:histidine kinase [Cyanobacteria bacterium UBA9273]HBL61857.1 histidine kinase [Cyanobacteria bacterium UBA8803]